jgi:hypothetical protein
VRGGEGHHDPARMPRRQHARLHKQQTHDGLWHEQGGGHFATPTYNPTAAAGAVVVLQPPGGAGLDRFNWPSWPHSPQPPPPSPPSSHHGTHHICVIGACEDANLRRLGCRVHDAAEGAGTGAQAVVRQGQPLGHHGSLGGKGRGGCMVKHLGHHLRPRGGWKWMGRLSIECARQCARCRQHSVRTHTHLWWREAAHAKMWILLARYRRWDNRRLWVPPLVPHPGGYIPYHSSLPEGGCSC